MQTDKICYIIIKLHFNEIVLLIAIIMFSWHVLDVFYGESIHICEQQSSDTCGT